MTASTKASPAHSCDDICRDFLWKIWPECERVGIICAFYFRGPRLAKYNRTVAVKRKVAFRRRVLAEYLLVTREGINENSIFRIGETRRRHLSCKCAHFTLKENFSPKGKIYQGKGPATWRSPLCIFFLILLWIFNDLCAQFAMHNLRQVFG